MIRRTALKALLALPFTPRLITEAGPLPVKRVSTYTQIYNSTGATLADMIEHWSGGIRPLYARILRIAGTDDVTKYMVTAQHPDGMWHSKTVLLSGLMLTMETSPSDHRANVAYGLAKRARELACDWAFLKWGNDWRRHVPPYRGLS